MDLLNKIEGVEHLAKANKLSRLLNSPLKYLHAIYVRKFQYPNKKIGIPKRCKTFFDQELEVVLPAGTDIYLLGAKTHDSEIRLAKFMIKQLEAGDCFLDIGAHFGYFSLLASELVAAEGRVLSVEASSQTFITLLKNLGERKNIKCLNIACTSSDGPISFFQFPVMYSEYNSLDYTQYEETEWVKEYAAEEITIEGLSVDSILKREVVVPKLIKIDVEGAEEQVVRGMTELMKQKEVPFLAMEFIAHDKSNVHLAAAKILERNGYLAHLILEDGTLSKINVGLIEKQLIKKGLDSDNVIFSPVY